MNFTVGQRVVCINDSIVPGEPGPYVVFGHVYTIRSIQRECGNTTLTFDELDAVPVDGWSTGYYCQNYRPAVERKTDTGFAILAEVLNGTRVPEAASP